VCVCVCTSVRVCTTGWSQAAASGAGAPRCHQLGDWDPGIATGQTECLSPVVGGSILYIWAVVCVFMCVCLQGIHAQPCYWLELEAWSCSSLSPFGVLDLETPNSTSRNTQSQMRNRNSRPSFRNGRGSLSTSTKYFLPQNERDSA